MSSDERLYPISPLSDPRWDVLLRHHPRASVFHTPGWLRALQRTYGYEPTAVTLTPPFEPLTNGIVFCVVGSWLTGNRLVSLPFSDHCEPLLDPQADPQLIDAQLRQLSRTERYRYIELRSSQLQFTPERGVDAAATFRLHTLDLRPTLDQLFRGFHKDCVQRKIRRAEREGLAYEVGRSDALLARFYELLCLTRLRHRLPPQPLAWFRHVVEELGENACIRVALKSGQPVAAMLTLHHGRTVTYKYGGSDARLHNLGGMAFLFWRTIEEAKAIGAEVLDLGRSDFETPGLIQFKERWSATSSLLTTWRTSGAGSPLLGDRPARYAKRMVGCMPAGIQALAGRWLYRHVG